MSSVEDALPGPGLRTLWFKERGMGCAAGNISYTKDVLSRVRAHKGSQRRKRWTLGCCSYAWWSEA